MQALNLVLCVNSTAAPENAALCLDMPCQHMATASTLQLTKFAVSGESQGAFAGSSHVNSM